MNDENVISEHEVLLSDVNEICDFSKQDLAVFNDKSEHEDPLVVAAISQHHKNQNNEDRVNEDKDELDLERNTFRIPLEHKRIKCGISWSFLDENKMIDLDLIVTALDLYSFEIDSVNKDHKRMFKHPFCTTKTKKIKTTKTINLWFSNWTQSHRTFILFGS